MSKANFDSPVKEPFVYIDSTNPIAKGVADIERITPTDSAPTEVSFNDWASPGFYNAGPPNPQNPLITRFGSGPGNPQAAARFGQYTNFGAPVLNPDQPLTMRSINNTLPSPNAQGNYNGVKPRPGCTPVTDLLLPETSTMVYTDKFFEQPNANLFLQNVQPNIYSYAVDTTPVNALASGISYTPQIPPRFRDQVYNNHEGLTYPIYTRVDPQLIRDDGVPARLLEQPVRGDWSAKYSSWEAAPGSVNYEDIYDGRYTGYGDPYRSYSDVNLGNVQYYYSDVDAYRVPNFVTRSKVDFIEFQDPMGKIKPHYQRTASLNDARPFVENQWTNDQLYFRESIMESNMRPANARNWQYRFAPLSRAAHSNFKSGPS